MLSSMQSMGCKAFSSNFFKSALQQFRFCNAQSRSNDSSMGDSGYAAQVSISAAYFVNTIQLLPSFRYSTGTPAAIAASMPRRIPELMPLSM